jgi:hypothetical protein
LSITFLRTVVEVRQTEKKRERSKGDARRENAERVCPSLRQATPKQVNIIFSSAQIINGIFCQFGRVYSARTVYWCSFNFLLIEK